VNIQQSAAPKASVQQLVFGAVNPNDFHTVYQDPTAGSPNGVAYASPQWQAATSGGNVTSNPDCYTRSGVNDGTDNMTVRATFSVSGFTGTNDLIEATSSSFAGACPPVPATLSNGQLIGTITAPIGNTVGDYAMNIAWRVSDNGGKTWSSAGNSTNKMYVTNGNPSGNESLETVLNTGCSAASGQSTYTGVCNSIWAKFKTRSINEVNGALMYYWGATSSIASHGPSGIPADFSTAGLIAQADGRCGAWADFLVDVWGAQGVPAYHSSVTPTDVYRGADAGVVRAAPTGVIISASGITTEVGDYASLIGFVVQTGVSQGGVTTQVFFSDHAVVRLGSTTAPGKHIYDPSYGLDFDTTEGWRNVSERYLVYTDPALSASGTVEFVSHRANKKDSEFSPDKA
jgi:hypothetical protein